MAEFISQHSYLLSQIFGFAAMATAISMYQFKRHRTVMLLMVLCSSLWCVHYAFLGLLSPILMNLVNVVRNFVCSFREKKWCQSIAIPVFFIALTVVLTVISWTGPECLLTMFASAFATVSCWMTDPKKLRYFTYPVCIGWFTYNFINHSIAATCNEAFTFVSVTVALIRFRMQEKKEKT